MLLHVYNMDLQIKYMFAWINLYTVHAGLGVVVLIVTYLYLMVMFLLGWSTDFLKLPKASLLV